MADRVKLEWDGETIKHTTIVEDIKVTPKDLINAVDNAKTQLDQMKEQEKKLLENLEILKTDIKSAKKFILDREEFEKKCVEICTEKLKKYIAEYSDEMKAKAEIEAEQIISKDPNAYTDQQIINQKYVLYQKYLATSKKVAENIPARLVKDLMFDTPIFENPFK